MHGLVGVDMNRNSTSGVPLGWSLALVPGRLMTTHVTDALGRRKKQYVESLFFHFGANAIQSRLVLLE